MFLLLLAAILISSYCYPVPIPGRDPKKMKQSLVTDYFTGISEGEGCRAHTGTAGATTWQQEFLLSANHGDGPPTIGLRPGHAEFSRISKRSYKRACKRASTSDFAWYRGRFLTWQDVPATLRNRICRSEPISSPPPTQKVSLGSPKGRWNMLYWNAGGLSQVTFQELKTWLLQHDLHGAIIAETRWSFTSEWQTDDWICVHSGSGHRSAGVLILLSRKVFASDHIGWRELAPGHLLHVKVFLNRRSFDILGFYQHTYRPDEMQLQLRTQFWTLFQDTVMALSNRNGLLIAGDANSNLQAHHPYVGRSTFKWDSAHKLGTVHKDSSIFQELLQTCGLCALNTWSNTAGPTYFHGSVASRIDYFLTRLGSGDFVSKNIAMLPEALFLPLNSTHHIPMICSIKKIQVSYRPTVSKGCSLPQRIRSWRACQQQSPEWTVFQTEALQRLHASASMLDTGSTPILDLHEQLKSSFHLAFPHCVSKPAVIDNVLGIIHNKWQLKRALGGIRSCTLDNLFRAWHLYTQFFVQHRMQRRQAKLDRKQRFHELCLEAEAAATRNDSFGMFSLINRYTPKTHMPRIRLRLENGLPANQYETHSLLVKFVQDQWRGPLTCDTGIRTPPGVPFSEMDLCTALASMPGAKSVAPVCLPGTVWRSLAPSLSHMLYQHLCQWWGQWPPYIPQEWKDSWLVMLPKAGRVNSSPQHLRPISLQEPVGKAVMGVLCKCLQTSLNPQLKSIPQFAYVEHRSALDAITRVRQHCCLALQLHSAQRRTVQRQMEDQTPLQTCGALQLFLDMSRAFDELSRVELFEHLADMHAPDSLRVLLEEWHSSTGYIIDTATMTTRVQVGKGVRLGCKIAPTLWSCFIHLVISKLIPRVGVTWIRNHLTIYADDFHICGIFRNKLELCQLVENFGHVLDVLAELRMVIQPNKSNLLLLFGGTSCRKIQKHYVKPHQNGATFEFSSPTGTQYAFPVSSSARYLGVVISYRHLTHVTMMHRLQMGRVAFSRLRCWLIDRTLGLKHRLHLWKSSVFSVQVSSHNLGSRFVGVTFC